MTKNKKEWVVADHSQTIQALSKRLGAMMSELELRALMLCRVL